MNIYALKLNRPLLNDEFNAMLSNVSDERRLKTSRFRNRLDAERGLIGEFLIRSIVGTRFDIKYKNVKLKTGKHGKPFVEGLEGFHYNLSHSGQWVVCATSSQPVGIDVEEILPISQNTISFVMNKNEFETYLGCNEEARLPFFYKVWTSKESFLKWTGSGLVDNLNDYYLYKVNETTSTILLDKLSHPCHIQHYQLNPNYTMAVCCEPGHSIGTPIIKTFEQLLK